MTMQRRVGAMTDRKRSWWGWGWQDEAVDDAQAQALGAAVAKRFGHEAPLRQAPELTDLQLPAPRVEPPDSLASICSTDVEDRAGHTHGKSFRDVVNGSYGHFDHPPDQVAHPRTEQDVVDLLDWCGSAGIAAIPYGGGSSVVGGVSCAVDDVAGVVSIDLTALDRVLDIEPVSRSARIQGGALGPVLEDQLRPHGYTLRHYPQSFEFSTLGGWLATRSGGHFATLYTHIDDLVSSIRAVTPTGISESRRLPGSGAGPSPDRLLLGSEGTLGIITEAWMRLQDRPVHKASAGVRFADFEAAVDATRAVAQSGLFPTNCRLLDAGEAASSAGVDDGSHLLMLGFESADHPVDTAMARAVEIATDHGGVAPDGIRTSSGGEAVGNWRSSFLRAPYGRDALIRLSMIVETFETACPWDRFGDLHRGVVDNVTAALDRICGGGTITCRFTHVYPDGPAPYFTVMAPGRPGSEIEQWDEIKAAATEALLTHGGTVTHHHAVGRDHRAAYHRQRPEVIGRALTAAKHELDPQGVLNPGVLL
jgi:alkyldihydroxyacetonephosphate synthase